MIHWKCLVSQETLTDWWNKLSISVWLQLSVCKELQLPSSEYNYTADLVAVTSAAPLESAGVQSISVLAVAVEGTARLWPSLAKEGNYTETDVDLGDLCNFVIAVRVSKWIDQSYFDTAAPFLFVIHTGNSPRIWTSLLLFSPHLFLDVFLSGWKLHLVLREESAVESECGFFRKAAVPSPAAGPGNALRHRAPRLQPVRYPRPTSQRHSESRLQIQLKRKLLESIKVEHFHWCLVVVVLRGEMIATFVSRTLSSVFCFPAAAPQRAVGGRSQLPLHADQLQSE